MDARHECCTSISKALLSSNLLHDAAFSDIAGKVCLGIQSPCAIIKPSSCTIDETHRRGRDGDLFVVVSGAGSC